MTIGSANSTRRSRWVYSLFGLAVALTVVGPPTGGAFLSNLDLVGVGTMDIDEAMIGLGSDLPRRAPLSVLLALISPPLNAATVLRLWMAFAVALAAVGMLRYLREVALPIRVVAVLLFAGGPFVMTRLAVGHLGFATAVALLPWTVELLLDPLRAPRRTFLALAAFAGCGYFGVLVFGPVIVIGLVSSRSRPKWNQVAFGVVSQLPWLIPAAAAVARASSTSSSSSFPTAVSTLADAFRLPVGFGFWRRSNEVLEAGSAAALIGVLVLVLALAGVYLSGYKYKQRLAWVAAIGLAGAVVSVTPGLETLVDRATSWGFVAPLREGHRLLALAVFSLIALAARGADALLASHGQRAQRGAWLLVVATVWFLAPGWWGLGGAARGFDEPRGWGQAEEIVASDPGPTLALPFVRYFDIGAAGGRRSHHPVPFLIDGDVIYSHDLGLGGQERVDDREELAATFVRALRFGEETSEIVTVLGLRWIVALPDAGGAGDIELLRNAGFVSALDTPEVTVFELAPSTEPANATEVFTPMWVAVGLVVFLVTVVIALRREISS